MRAYILPALAVLSVILYISTFFGSKGPEPLFKGITKGTITEIEIKKAGVEYLIKKTDKGWVLQKPVQWPADGNKVNSLIETALKTRVENPITDKKEDFERYKVRDGDDYITLKAPQKQTTVIVGKRGPRYSLIYVRRKGDENVYLVEASFADELPTGKNSFRDKTLWEIEKENILSVKWTLNGRTFHMAKSAKQWLSEQGSPLPEAEVDAYLTYLSHLKAVGFPEKDELPEKAEKMGGLEVQTKNKRYSLSLYKTPKDNYYILYNGHVYKSAEYQKDEIFRQIKGSEK